MVGSRTGRSSCMDTNFYPVQTNLIDGARRENDAVFLVDVGGGKGHDLQEVYRKHPKLPGKLVLQETKGVLEEAKEECGLDGKIVLAEHDFFTRQTILGMSINRTAVLLINGNSSTEIIRCTGLLYAFLSARLA